MLPSELFAKLAPSIFVVQSVDAYGKVISFGSAIVVGSGQLVTNKHVIKRTAAIRVRHGKRTWSATLTHLDPKHDLCQLAVEGLEAPSVLLRDYATLAVGERVYAIGAPEGFDLTLSEGLISGLRRRANTDVVQTTAPISHGSSGGGLFDSEGRLIGVTTYYIEEAQSLNFAISAELVATLSDHPSTGESNLPFEDSESQASGLDELASQEFRNGKYGAAMKLYREAVAVRPQNETNWVYLGICCFKVSLFEDSTEAFREALRLKPQLAEVWKWQGMANHQLRKLDLAIEAFKEAIRLGAKDVYAWVGLADAYYDMGSLDEARATYLEATRVNPQADYPWRRLGISYLDTNDYTAATSAFQEAIRREPDAAYNWYFLGIAYYRQGNLEKNLQVLRRLEELDPKLARQFARTFNCR